MLTNLEARRLEMATRITRALSIKQPFVDQILRGRKKIEYRSIPTKILGERIYIYASEKPRRDVGGYSPDKIALLPRGVIVGTVVIAKCCWNDRRGIFEWHLTAPKRLPRYLKPKNKPQPVWFKPF
jgi:hypothetical protein